MKVRKPGLEGWELDVRDEPLVLCGMWQHLERVPGHRRAFSWHDLRQQGRLVVPKLIGVTKHHPIARPKFAAKEIQGDGAHVLVAVRGWRVLRFVPDVNVVATCSSEAAQDAACGMAIFGGVQDSQAAKGRHVHLKPIGKDRSFVHGHHEANDCREATDPRRMALPGRWNESSPPGRCSTLWRLNNGRGWWRWWRRWWRWW